MRGFILCTGAGAPHLRCKLSCLYAADANHLLMRDLLKRIGKPNPRICYLPVAHGNDRARIAFWYETMQHFPCVPRHQRVFIGTSDYPDWETELFAADCIFVGGGNTLNMIAIGAPRALTKFCARRGSAVLSCQAKAPARFAGSNAVRPTLARESCRRLMGLAKGSLVRISTTPGREETMMAMAKLSDGYAYDEGAAFYFEGDPLVETVKNRPEARVFRLAAGATPKITPMNPTHWREWA
jgi:dipeptidase E